LLNPANCNQVTVVNSRIVVCR